MQAETEADVVAGERLARGEGPAWQPVWERFAEAPESYPGIGDLLRRNRPSSELRFHRWPDLKRGSGASSAGGAPEAATLQACTAVVDLERQHAERRGWVWARLGKAPWAHVLEPLARLAAAARSALGGTTPGEWFHVSFGLSKWVGFAESV